jgi:uncharacterized membrane protein YqjE
VAYQEERRTIGNLLTDVLGDVTHLFQTEIRLIRVEFNEKLSRLANGGVLIAVGAVAALAAMFLLLQAIVRWLEIAGLPNQWGYLIVGVIIAAGAAFALVKGINNIKSTSLVPDRTLEQVRADVATVKEHVR